MAQLENIQTKKAHDPDSRYTEGGAVEQDTTVVHDLDKPDAVKRLSQFESWFEYERGAQAENRYQMALDQDFYDGLQYSEDDAAELMERGQAPLVFNEIKPTIDWMVGTERRTKFDFDVLPRKKDDGDLAGVKRDVLKYISDVNRIPFERSQAFKESVICGLGWMEDGIRGDNEDDPIFSQSESWRNVWYDSNAKKLDLSDARYLFRRKVLDLDVAIALVPDRESKLRSSAMDMDVFKGHYDDDYYLGQPLKQSANGTTPVASFSRYAGSAIGSGGQFLNRRERVEIIEVWERRPARVQKMRGDLFDGEVYDGKNEKHRKAYDDQIVSLYDTTEMQMWVSLFVKGALLWTGRSPYKHNRFGLTPLWCYRRGRDNAPYGAVRNQRDQQEDLNKRASKALFILSTNQIIMEEDAVEDIEETRDEAARPDGVLIKRKGKEFEVRQDKLLAEEHLKLMDMDAISIRNSGGVTDENLGRGSNAQSGKAIIARQTQGSVVTAEIFDNYMLSFQIQGENLLSLSEQYYSMPKIIRISGNKKGVMEWTEINQPQDDGTYLNDITETKADFLVDEMDYRETIRQAMFEQMMDMASKMPPELAIKLLDLVFEESDVQNRDEWVKRIRQINGQGKDEEDMSEEEIQQVKEQKKQESEAAELEKRAATAKVAEVEAKVAHLEAQAHKTNADTINATVDGVMKALQAAGVVAQTPGIAPVADEILQDAGHQDQGGVDQEAV